MTGGRRRAPQPAEPVGFQRSMLRAAYLDLCAVRFEAAWAAWNDPANSGLDYRHRRWWRALEGWRRAMEEAATAYKDPSLEGWREHVALSGVMWLEWLSPDLWARLSADVDRALERLRLRRRLSADELQGLRFGVAEWFLSSGRLDEFVTYAGRATLMATPIGDIEVGREQIGVSPSGRPIVGIDRRPLVRVAGVRVGAWWPDEERRSAARRRLLAAARRAGLAGDLGEAIDAELDRIEHHAREAGYEIADTRSAVRRHLLWLVMHAWGAPYREIVDLVGQSDWTVVEAVQALAREIGVDLPH